MENMDHFRERFEVLERRTQVFEQRLRRWRGLAGGLLVLGLLSWALPSGKAADSESGTMAERMAERMATLEKKLTALAFNEAANEVIITGANLRIVNGLGDTRTTNGLGNLIVGYNESRAGFCPESEVDRRAGSHNVVVGKSQNFSHYGGIVVGFCNEISGDFASVIAGVGNTASGTASSVSGGNGNTASGHRSAIGGGVGNTASADASSISGGSNNTASGTVSSVSGGQFNTASGFRSSVSGGVERKTVQDDSWAAGSLGGVEVSGNFRSP